MKKIALWVLGKHNVEVLMLFCFSHFHVLQGVVEMTKIIQGLSNYVFDHSVILILYECQNEGILFQNNVFILIVLLSIEMIYWV